MQKTQNFQDTFLNLARRDKVPVTMFLTNGFQMRGTIRGFDGFTVVIESDGRQQLVYKHAISTIAPSRALNLWSDMSETQDTQDTQDTSDT